MPRRQSPNSKKNALARERELKAFELRKAGATLKIIADELGITEAGVSLILKRVLARTAELTAEKVEDVRRLEIERLDAMLLGLWDRARRGNEKAVEACLKIMKRRADLLGLDAAKAMWLSGPDDGPIQFQSTRESLLSKLARLEEPE